MCACMEATAELFLADGFEPAPEGGEQQQQSVEQGAGAPAQPAAARPGGRVVQIEEID